MKKPSISFDRAKLTRFFVAHVEKVGIGIAVAVFGYLVFGVVRQETFDRRPEDLQQLVSSAQTHISQSKLTPETVPQTVGPYKQLAEESKEPIRMVVREWRPIKPPEFGSSAKRGEPQFLPAESLEISAGYGAFNTDLGPKGYRWALIVALVPWDEQVSRYNAVFRDAADWDAVIDRPRYAGCWVERIEITPGADGEQAKSTKFAVTSQVIVRRFFEGDGWADTSSDPVPPAFIADEDLVFPLGPLTDAHWGDEITHSKLPLPENELLDQQARNEDQPRGASLSVRARRQAGGGLRAARGQAGGRLSARTTQRETRENRTQGARPGASRPAPGDDPFANRQDEEEEPVDEFEEDPAEEDAALPPYRLVRMFDFGVQPGKQYRYRLLLMFENPNLGMEERLLKEAKFAKERFRRAPWSEASPIVTIPRDSDLLAVGEAQKKRGATEAKGNVIARYWDAEQGILVPHREFMSPGQVANFKIDGIGFHGPSADSSVNLEKKVDVETNTMLLDVEGGDKLPGSRGRLTEPAEMLFLDAQGRLVRRDELADQDEFAAWDGLIDQYIEASTGPGKNPRDRKKKAPGAGLRSKLLQGSGREPGAQQEPRDNSRGSRNQRNRGS